MRRNPERRGKRRQQNLCSTIGLGLAYAPAIAFSLAPFIWFTLTALKAPADVTAVPPRLFFPPQIHSFVAAIRDYGILGYLRNSIIVAGCTTIITVACGTCAGYGLARLPGRPARILLLLILAAAMFPQIAIAGPLWRMLRALGWLNTYQGLIIPYVALTLPLAIWVLAIFLRELPADLEAAALVDGCTRLGALVRVVIPLAAPGMFTAAILCFIHAWNEFFLALLIMTDPARQTLPVGIALFQGEHTIPWGEIAAASTITTLPLVVLVLIFQQRIISGLSAGAVKG
jgi:multiple sugar transport system permease protein